MPKKPFTQEEVEAQRHRIMDSASRVMAEVGFHHLSMRKLAGQLGMTASNIYNYFPSKEALFLHTRRRGFELMFAAIQRHMKETSTATQALYAFTGQWVEFAQRYPGYYQLMFQPPLLRLNESDLIDQQLHSQVQRQAEEWQQHILALLKDAIPGYTRQSDTQQKRLALFFVASVHGLVDAYRYRAFSELLAGVELIPHDVIFEHISWLLSLVERQTTDKV
jgi:AcrR family transcriptional regulator